jgi:LysR family transcriptional regulator, hypochlorite-specific transcription factor HypT
MDTRWFQDFVTLADVQNFTKAAELRNVSQAAFSRRIQALEQWLGAKLIDRASFPTTLTPAGNKFRTVAIGLLDQIADAKAEVASEPSRNHVKIALTYTLARTRLPTWWDRWSDQGTISCSLDVGNVHDTVSAFSAGLADILIAFDHTMFPIQLDRTRFDRHDLGGERLRPYALKGSEIAATLNGLSDRVESTPLLMYSPGSYFARIVDSVVEQSTRPLSFHRAFQCDMTDVLADLAVQGLGVAWLPDSSFMQGQLGDLEPVGGGTWDVDVGIVAYRAKSNSRAVVGRLWDMMIRGA